MGNELRLFREWGCIWVPRGCGREFGSLRDFDRHWTKVTTEDDPDRDRSTVELGGRRCATDVELKERGMEVGARGVWRDAENAARMARNMRPNA